MPNPIALWVSPVSELAGVARHIIDVATVGLPGWRLVVAAPEGPLLDRLRELGVAVLPLPMTSTRRTTLALRHILKRLRPTIAHSHLAKAVILLAAASAGLPVVLVTTEHHISPDRYMFHPTRTSAATMETVHRIRLTRFRGAIAVSESTRRDMLARWHPRLPIHTILNGVDRPVPSPARQPGLRLLSLSRLAPEKNVAMALRAFSLLASEHPDARLTVAGQGPEDEALRALAASLGVDDRTSFPGFVDARRAMAEHDVLIQPSLSDNCSYSLLDAVANGMGVAASPIGGNPEILPARCIADFGDDRGLADIAVAQGQELRLRAALADHVPTVAGMAEQITEVYREVAAPGRTRDARTEGTR